MSIINIITLLYSAVFISFVSTATMGIDLGGNYIKVSIVTARNPMETVLDRDSNRKTLSVLGFKDGRLVFADTAISLYRRQPENVVRNVETLLGHKFDDVSAVRYRELYPHLNMSRDETDDGILIHFSKFNLTFTPIELFAMWLNEIKGYTSAYANMDIADALIAVNPSVYQAEIDAIISAAKLSKLNLMEITDLSRTIATQYIVGHKRYLQNAAQNIMFVDVGAVTTLVTIACVGLEQSSKKNISIGSFNITGIGYESVGGSNFDEILKNFMIEDFSKINNIDVDLTKDHKINLKFLSKAEGVKHVLTASKKTNVFMEEVYDFKNYQTIFEQKDIETKAVDVLWRIGNSIERALLSSKIKLDELSDVIIMGGATLMPVVQEIISTKTRLTPSRVMNTEESNSAGASILAAKVHQFINVIEFKAPSVIYYPIEIETTFSVITSHGMIESKHQIDLLYPFLAKQTAKKVLTLSNVTDDFVIRARYAQFPHHLNIEELDAKDIMDIQVSGVKKALEQHPEYIPRHISIHFRIDIFRRLAVVKAEYILERNQSDSILGKMGKAVMDLFNLGSTNSTVDSGDVTASENITNSSSTNNSNIVNETEKQLTSNKQNLTIALSVTVELLYLRPPSHEQMKESRAKLRKLYAEERIRSENVKARSDVDSAVFNAESIFESGELNEYFTDEELANAIEVVANVKEWVETSAHEADTSQCKSKSQEIRAALFPAKNRVKEKEELNKAMQMLNDTCNRTHQIVGTAVQSPELAGVLKTTAALKMINLTIEARQWLNEKKAQQSLLKPTDEPAMKVGEIRLKIRDLEQSANVVINLVKEMLSQKHVPKDKNIDTNTTKETENVTSSNETATINETTSSDDTKLINDTANITKLPDDTTPTIISPPTDETKPIDDTTTITTPTDDTTPIDDHGSTDDTTPIAISTPTDDSNVTDSTTQTIHTTSVDETTPMIDNMLEETIDEKSEL